MKIKKKEEDSFRVMVEQSKKNGELLERSNISLEDEVND